MLDTEVLKHISNGNGKVGAVLPLRDGRVAEHTADAFEASSSSEHPLKVLVD